MSKKDKIMNIDYFQYKVSFTIEQFFSEDEMKSINNNHDIVKKIVENRINDSFGRYDNLEYEFLEHKVLRGEEVT